MPIDKRTFIISNLRRDGNAENNNDITIQLPDSIFSGNVEAINLKHMYVDFETEIIGNTNYEFKIAYPTTSTPISIKLELNRSSSTIVKTDIELARLIATSINTKLGVTVFQTFFDLQINFDRDIYRDNSALLGSYTIFTDNNTPFNIDFSSKNSIGPLLGYGNEKYTNLSSYQGGNIPSIAPYESIRIMNKAFDPTFKQYDALSDLACKFDLYDNAGQLIENYLDPRDTTISIPIFDGFISSIYEFNHLIETEMNRYSNAFPDNPTFSIFYDIQTNKFTISNDKNCEFGIGFRFNRPTGGINNYGSLHRHLGFHKQIYLGYKSITSIYPAKIFETAYINEYIFVCSDLIRHNYDSSLIISESRGKASQYESIFTIPIDSIVNNAYTPQFENEHRVRINASRFAKRYNESLPDPKTINFYLKLSSGRHIKLSTQWSIKLEIEYVN